ncbi:alpha/beta hydrolase [Streptomyces sp. NPDC052052]|uniref:alpha/beta hydrolase n=1 Tax=Streptomyces sp. NPDC052052 TaxID=3154756 RepID=UPI003424EA1D
MRTSAALRTAALTATVLLPLSACSESRHMDDPDGPRRSAVAAHADEASSLAVLAGQKLTWKPCPAPSVAQGGGAAPSPLPDGTPWDCSTMKVPLDYAKPGGETIDLALIRARTKNPANRIGSLVFNFGGPGSSGVATLPAFGTLYDRLRPRFDLVSFDPRGVGSSAGVKCETDQQLDARLGADSTPDSSDEANALLEINKRFVAACEKHSGRELPYVGTTNAARDMDLMRQVLGDKKLYYFGISYGTQLGGVYANLFPKNVGRAVLDAVVDPTLNYEQTSLRQAQGFQLALDNFAQDCVDRGAACKLPGTDRKEVEQGIVGLLDRLGQKPIAGLGNRQLTQSLAITGIAAALYSKETWPLLEEGVDEADGGNGALLLALADSLNGRSDNGHYDNSLAANTAISCADSRQRFTVNQVQARLPQFQSVSPVFGDYLGWGLLTCTGWPVAGAWDTPDVSAPGAAPILVIGNTGDPATPYKGAQAMAQALGKGVGVELTYKGQGHGAYNSGDACVQKAVDGYLLDGRVPAAGTVCS